MHNIWHPRVRWDRCSLCLGWKWKGRRENCIGNPFWAWKWLESPAVRSLGKKRKCERQTKRNKSNYYRYIGWMARGRAVGEEDDDNKLWRTERDKKKSKQNKSYMLESWGETGLADTEEEKSCKRDENICMSGKTTEAHRPGDWRQKRNTPLIWWLIQGFSGALFQGSLWKGACLKCLHMW